MKTEPVVVRVGVRPKNARSASLSPASATLLPDFASLSALRAWHEGLTAREAVKRYLDKARNDGQSSRGIIARIRRQLTAGARIRQRHDLIPLFAVPAVSRTQYAAQVAAAIDALRVIAVAAPQPADAIHQWLVSRTARALESVGVRSLGELMVYMQRRRRWWQQVPGLGETGARAVAKWLDGQPEMMRRAAQVAERMHSVEQLLPVLSLAALPTNLDGSHGRYRAPPETCGLAATTDVEAVTAWLAIHESAHTARAYRREAERLLLWAVAERRLPLSSLTVEDATAFRGFLRRPAPAARWVGPHCPRNSPSWRPFERALTPRSTAYALTVLRALFSWLVDQHYVVINPFAGVTVRGARPREPFDTARALDDREWKTVRTFASRLERHGWNEAAAQRLRFVLDFGYATGLRASELVSVKLGDIERDQRGAWWLNVTGKGTKPGRVALPPLWQYLKERRLPVTRARWIASIPLLAALDRHESKGQRPTPDVSGHHLGISAARLRQMISDLFQEAALHVEGRNPRLAARLRQVSPHWLRHTHATHALTSGVELVTVRDNLRHASISTTSTYLHGNDRRRSHQVGAAFGRTQPRA
jgi:site-specific recombinase XerD